MKFRVTMKTPDVLEDAINDLEIEYDESMTPDEVEEAKEDLKCEARSLATEYIKYGEYLTVEFDTIAKTAKVVKA